MLAIAQQSNILDFPTVAPQGKSNEWYTPARYIEAAREVMGSIDLDPASCEVANRTVKAKRYFTEQDNGLNKTWYGNVWLNPPYGKAIPYTSRGRYMGGGSTKIKSLQTQFIEKALSEYKAGMVSQVMLLVTANTTVKWFLPLWEYPICTPYSKIAFSVLGCREKQRQVFGNVFVYLGSNEQKFIDIFSQFGTIAKRVSQPRHTIATPSLWEVAQ